MGKHKIEIPPVSKELYYIMKAPSEKRFDNFIHTVCDREEVYMIGNQEGF